MAALEGPVGIHSQVKEMRLQQIATLEQANRFLERAFWPFWQQRFAVQPVLAVNPYSTPFATEEYRTRVNRSLSVLEYEGLKHLDDFFAGSRVATITTHLEKTFIRRRKAHPPAGGL